MKRQIKQTLALLLTGVLTTGLAGCGGGGAKRPEGELSGPITISSSNTALPLLAAARQQFTEKHPQVQITLVDDGSSKALEQVAAGKVDIGLSQIPATPEQGRELKEHRIVMTPYAVIVHRDLALNNLPLDKAGDIFKGKIQNWSDVGGPDSRITVVATPEGTGTRAAIASKVLEGDGEITKDAVLLESTRQVQERVAITVGSIGYVEGPLFNPDKAKAVKIDQVAFAQKVLAGGNWPIFVYEHLYTPKEPKEPVRAFVDFLLSREFQQSTAEQLTYIPIHGSDR